MTLADDIWLGSVAARNNLMAAANYSAAFYGNAAVQSWALGLRAPQRFWTAMARAMDDVHIAPCNAEAATGLHATEVAENTAEVSATDTDADPVAVPEVTQAAAPDEEPPAAALAAVAEDPAAAPMASPLLLDAPRGDAPDDLTAVKGIGVKMAASLNEFGIYHYDQIAALDAAGIDWLDENLPGFKRNCARFDLVSGAAELV